MILVIPDEFMVRLYNYSEEVLPNEAAALLFGIVEEHRAIVQNIKIVQNMSSNPRTSFSIDPEEEYRLLVKAEERSEALVAIYHSHPAPPRPSSLDLRFMHLNPVIWLIASKTSGKWKSRAYIIENNELCDVRVDII